MFMVNSCYWFSNAVIEIVIDVCCCRCCCCLYCLCFVAVVCVVYVVYVAAAIDDDDVVAVVVELEAQNFVEERAPAEKSKSTYVHIVLLPLYSFRT